MVAHDSSAEVLAEVNAHCAEILIALGKDQEAFDKIDEAVRVRQVTESMRRELETTKPRTVTLQDDRRTGACVLLAGS